MQIDIHTTESSYPVHFEMGALYRLGNYLDLDRKVFILTDAGLPRYYAELVADQCQKACIYTLPQGEGSKSLENAQQILSSMLAQNWSRTDCVLAIGGGVVGDLAGFVASIYMRGIDFYNLPTSLLAQVDASIGGKTGINLSGIKNVVGSFYPPRAVVTDPNLLQTLPNRHFNSGMAEVIKMALTLDPELYDFLVESDREEVEAQIDYVISDSIRLKQRIVEEDEREFGLRRVLNFGHTVGHAIEANSLMTHGEAVACGMTYFVSDAVKATLLPLLHKYDLPDHVHIPADVLYTSLVHDKKVEGEAVHVVAVPEPGEFVLEDMTLEEMKDLIERGGYYC